MRQMETKDDARGRMCIYEGGAELGLEGSGEEKTKGYRLREKRWGES